MRTLLETWIKRKIGLPEKAELTRDQIAAYQLRKLKETLCYAKDKSLFYKKHLKGIEARDIGDLSGFSNLPFTNSNDIKTHGAAFLCVSQSEVERVVTLNSSGTTGESKRLFFTHDDLELTIDFFHHGMMTVVEPGQKVLILMPGDRPGSIGDLLKKGLSRFDVEGIVLGPVMDPVHVIETILSKKIEGIVGIPSQVLWLTRHELSEKIPPGQIKSVLISADYGSDAVISEIKNKWRCAVFDHYGMTEMGLGGALACHADPAYHFREADLYFEIIEPETGRVMPDGEYGEIVFTTLTRSAMPLIRYKTGDCSRFIPETCPCGTVLKRMEKVSPRRHFRVSVGNDVYLGMPELDEAIFTIPDVANFSALMVNENGGNRLGIRLYAPHGDQEKMKFLVNEKLMRLPVIQNAVLAGHLRLCEAGFLDQNPHTTGVVKRMIQYRNTE